MRKNAPFNPALFIACNTAGNPKRPGTAAYAKYAVVLACHGLTVAVYNVVCALVWATYRAAGKVAGGPAGPAAAQLWGTLAAQLQAQHGVTLAPATLAAAAASGLGAGELQWCMAPTRAYIALTSVAPKAGPGGMVAAAQAAVAAGAPAASAVHAAAQPAIAGAAPSNAPKPGPVLVKRGNAKARK